MEANIFITLHVKHLFGDANELVGLSSIDHRCLIGQHFRLRLAGIIDESMKNLTPIAIYVDDNQIAEESSFAFSKEDREDPYAFIQALLKTKFSITDKSDDGEMLVDTICDGILELDFIPSSLGKITASRSDYVQLPKPLTSKEIKSLNYLVCRTVDYAENSIRISKKSTSAAALKLLTSAANDDSNMPRYELTAIAFVSAK